MTFSFVLPVTRRTFLAETLECLAAQEGEFEVVLVDDSERGYVRAHLPQELRSRSVILQNEANRGRGDPTIPWNQGLQRASGDYVILIGDDDLVDPSYLQAMRDLIRRLPDHDLYRCRLRIVDAAGAVRDLGFRLPELESWDEFLYMRNRYLRPHSTVEYCARRAKLVAIGGYASLPLALGSDDLTWLLMSLDRPIVSTNDSFASWRISDRSICGSAHSRALRQAAHIELFQRERRIIEQVKPSVVPRELLVESLLYRFQGFLNNAGFRGSARRFVAYLLPSAVEKAVVSLYKRSRNQDLGPHFLPSDG